MENAAPSGTPPATTSVTPAAPAASSSTVQQDLGSKAKAAVTPAELRGLTEELRKNQLKPAAPTPLVAEPAPVQETPAAEPATETPQEETPEVVGDTDEAETPAEDAPEGEAAEDDGEGPVTPLTGKRAHLRLNENDEVGRLALSYSKRNKDWTLDQAMDAARNQLGIKPKQEAQAPAAEDPKVAALPRTIDDVDVAIEKLFADQEKAMTEVRFEDASKAFREIQKLTLHRSSLERSAEQAQQQQAARYDADFTKSESQAVDLYPFAADQASAGAKRMSQIEATMLKNGDPAYYSANKPLLLAQMVAAELKIAPRNKNATPAKAAALAVPVPKKGVLPTGGSRTVPVTNQKPALVQALSKPNMTVHELRGIMRRVGIQT